MTYQIEIKSKYTMPQRKVIYRMNRNLRGLSSSRTRMSTLEKLNLTGIVNKHTNSAITSSKRKTVLVVDRASIKSKPFDKKMIEDFIVEYYETKSAKIYLDRYDNDKHKSADINVPNFTSRDLEDDEFFNNIKKHKYAKMILSPISKYITVKYEKNIDGKKSLPDDMKTLKEKISKTIVGLTTREKVQANQRTTQTPVITVEELRKYFHQLVGGHRIPIMKSKALEMLKAVLAFYSYNGFRDDLGELRLDPSNELKKTSNYIEMNTGKVVIQPKKGANGITVTLPEENMRVLRAYVGPYPREYMFVKKNGLDPIPRMDKLITRLFSYIHKEVVTINNFRQAWSTFARQSGDVDVQILRSEMMGHTVTTAITYYARS